MGESTDDSARKGIFYGLAAYGAWGIVPLYFKSVQQVPTSEMLAHRIVWSTLLLLLTLIVLGRGKELIACLRDPRSLKMLLLSTAFIATNWYVYIYSVLSNQIMQGSLGYFILPLVNVAIGTLFFRERMTALQWLAVSFAAVGVIVLTMGDGKFPWIALTLAFSFSIYGVLRKQAAVDGVIGLTVETLLLMPIAAGFLIYCAAENRLIFAHRDRALDALIILSGLVTSIPLICFAQAVQRLRIITIGFLQYISPTLAFLIAVLLYDEKFPPVYQLGYGMIWCGLAIFVADTFMRTRSRVEVNERRREAEVVPLD